MSLHFSREITKVKAQILSLGGMVEDCVHNAVEALFGRDLALAARVVDSDEQIDQLEVEIEEACLKLLALYQPVAVDLRLLVAVLKINNELERVGDLGVNIARRVPLLAGEGAYEVPPELTEMAARARAMLREALDSLVHEDARLARQVLVKDEEMDELNLRVFGLMRRTIEQEPSRAGACLYLLTAARFLERMADHCTNIAEDVIYLIDGVIIRHAAMKARDQMARLPRS